MNFYIYVHTTPNNKKYVGVTKRQPEIRWGKNGEGYKNQPFYCAIEEFGWDNITHEIVFSNLSENEAREKEIELIRLYNSQDKDCGYNVLKGGTIIQGKPDGYGKAISCRTDKKVLEKLKEIAKSEKRSLNNLISKILSDFVEDK